MNLVPESVKEKFSKLFPNEDERQRVEEALEIAGTEAKEAGLEFKDAEAETEVEVETVESEDVPSEPLAEAEVETQAEVKDAETLDRKEVEDAIALLSKAIGDVATMIESLAKNSDTVSDALKTMDARIASLEKTDEEKIADIVKETPRLSLSELVLGQIGTVVGKDATRVDGRTTLGGDGPQETEVAKSIVQSGNPLFDASITDIVERGLDSIR